MRYVLMIFFGTGLHYIMMIMIIGLTLYYDDFYDYVTYVLL